MKRTCILSLLVALGMFGTTGVRLAQARGERVDASAAGGYQVVFPSGERTIEFVAVNENGESRGEGQLFNHVSGTTLHFTIDCLSVVGNVATMSGTVDRSNISVPADTRIWLSVADNGDGPGSADLVTPLFVFFGPPSPRCTDAFLAPSFPIQGGNIRVQ